MEHVDVYMWKYSPISFLRGYPESPEQPLRVTGELATLSWKGTAPKVSAKSIN